MVKESSCRGKENYRIVEKEERKEKEEERKEKGEE